MQINSTPLAAPQTQPQRPATPVVPPQQELSPEEQRAQTVQRQDSLQAVQENRQANQDRTRQAAVAVVANEQQQQNIERYIEASSGADVDSGPSLASQIETLQNIARNVRVNELANAADANSAALEARREQNPGRLPDRPENLPSIDEIV